MSVGQGVAERIAQEFPLLWEIAEKHAFAECLGGSTDPLTHEVDAALRELCEWRREREESLPSVEDLQGVLGHPVPAEGSDGSSC